MAILASSAELLSLDDVRLHKYSEGVLASREWVRLLAVLGAVAVDLSQLLVASLVARYLRYGNLTSGSGGVLLLIMLPSFLFASLTYQSYSLSTLRNWFRSIARVNAAFLTSIGFAFTAAFALDVSARVPRLESAILFLIAPFLLTIGRAIGSAWLTKLHYAAEPITFVLGDDTVDQHARRADRVFNVRRLNWSPSADDPEFLDLICRRLQHADRVLLVFSKADQRVAWASFMRLTGINTEVLEPQLAYLNPYGIERWRGAPTLVISRGPLSLAERVMKRAFDLGLLLVLAPAVFPVVAFLAILIKLESPGPCLFVQDRVGRQNRRYRCYKLRTMRAEATDASGERSASRDDDRVTSIGRFLRRTSLDELPQLWNVLLGNMSFVGPRPHALGSTADGALFWKAVNGYWSRHAVKPGLTGLAQIRGFRGATLSVQDIERRVSADLEYVNNWSIWLDLKILIKTPFVMVHRNAF